MGKLVSALALALVAVVCMLVFIPEASWGDITAARIMFTQVEDKAASSVDSAASGQAADSAETAGSAAGSSDSAAGSGSADAGADSADSSGSGADADPSAPVDPADETPLDKAMRLIAVLPADPDEITEADRSAIEAAGEAYDALTDEERATLDATAVVGKEQTYGRWLESAQWGYTAQQPLDNTLDVVDGDYSAYVTSASSMGKSNSERARTWSVAKLTVADGKATAIVRCGSRSAFRNMRIGGVDYAATVVEGVPEFEVPLRVNDTVSFTIDANAVADSIAYQMTSTLPLEPATASALSAAAKKAADTKAQASKTYEAASAAAVAEAADALAAVAAKDGAYAVEIDAATAVLDAAVSSAVPVAPEGSGDGDDSGKDDGSGKNDGKENGKNDGKNDGSDDKPSDNPGKGDDTGKDDGSGKGDGADDGDDNSGKGDSNSDNGNDGDDENGASSKDDGGSNGTASTDDTGDLGDGDSGDDESSESSTAASGTSLSQVVPTVASSASTSSTASSSKPSAASAKPADSTEKGGKDPDGARGTAAKGPDNVTTTSASDAASVTPVAASGSQAASTSEQKTMAALILAGLFMALLLGGMVARTFLFLRAKAVA